MSPSGIEFDGFTVYFVRISFLHGHSATAVPDPA
jgi:hypothetical protein